MGAILLGSSGSLPGGIIGTPIGTPTNNQVATWVDATTLKGEPNLTFDGNSLYVNGTVRSSEIKYWSCAGVHFDPTEPDVNQFVKHTDGFIYPQEDGIFFVANVDLPNGAVITGVECYGNAGASGEVWYLRRIKLSDASLTTLATATFNTEDTSISGATVDNSLYAYFFYTSSLDTNDQIYGARIIYTY